MRIGIIILEEIRRRKVKGFQQFLPFASQTPVGKKRKEEEEEAQRWFIRVQDGRDEMC
jgi:DNA-binding TFAR19-related protein (PDSD5 family)